MRDRVKEEKEFYCAYSVKRVPCIYSLAIYSLPQGRACYFRYKAGSVREGGERKVEKGRKGRVQRKKKGRWAWIAHAHAERERARAKVERNIKKHSVALEIHVI